MQGNAAAVCYNLAPGAKEAGYNGGNVGVGLPGVATTIRPTAQQGIAAKVEQALQAALHGANSVSGPGANMRGGGGISSGAQVIPFPMVDPLLPIRRAGRPPVAGYTAFPAPQNTVQPARNRRVARIVYREVSEPGRRISNFNTRGNEDAGPPAIDRDLSGFGDLTEQIPSGISLEDPGFNGLGSLGSLGETKLQTILGTIATTLPATVSAFKGQPYYPAQNLYGVQAQQGYTEYPRGVAPTTGGAAQNVGAGVGSAVDTLGNTVSRFVAEHPYLVIGGGAALVLLFMNPPRRR